MREIAGKKSSWQFQQERSRLQYGRNDFCTFGCHYFSGTCRQKHSEAEKKRGMRRKLQWMFRSMYVSHKRYEKIKKGMIQIPDRSAGKMYHPFLNVCDAAAIC